MQIRLITLIKSLDRIVVNTRKVQNVCVFFLIAEKNIYIDVHKILIYPFKGIVIPCLFSTQILLPQNLEI